LEEDKNNKPVSARIPKDGIPLRLTRPHERKGDYGSSQLRAPRTNSSATPQDERRPRSTTSGRKRGRKRCSNNPNPSSAAVIHSRERLPKQSSEAGARKDQHAPSQSKSMRTRASSSGDNESCSSTQCVVPMNTTTTSTPERFFSTVPATVNDLDVVGPLTAPFPLGAVGDYMYGQRQTAVCYSGYVPKNPRFFLHGGLNDSPALLFCMYCRRSFLPSSAGHHPYYLDYSYEAEHGGVGAAASHPQFVCTRCSF